MTPEERWETAQRRARSHGTTIRVDSCRLELMTDAGYAVAIEGAQLHPSIVRPSVTVGGLPVEQLEFRSDGRTIVGRSSKKPPRLDVVVDYGFAIARLST